MKHEFVVGSDRYLLDDVRSRPRVDVFVNLEHMGSFNRETLGPSPTRGEVWGKVPPAKAMDTAVLWYVRTHNTLGPSLLHKPSPADRRNPADPTERQRYQIEVYDEYSKKWKRASPDFDQTSAADAKEVASSIGMHDSARVIDTHLDRGTGYGQLIAVFVPWRIQQASASHRK